VPIKSIKTALKTALKDTGIKDFTFHDLRHTFNTNMQNAGVRDTVTMQMTGHRTLSMFTRYSSVGQRDVKEAMAKFNAFLEQEGQGITAISTAEKAKGAGDATYPLDFIGSPGRTRTADPVVNSHLLCQLSYWGSFGITGNAIERGDCTCYLGKFKKNYHG
jgi:Phage integrase family